MIAFDVQSLSTHHDSFSCSIVLNASKVIKAMFLKFVFLLRNIVLQRSQRIKSDQSNESFKSFLCLEVVSLHVYILEFKSKLLKIKEQNQ